MEDARYKIWVSGFIKKVSLEELAQMTIADKMEKVWYVEKGNKKMLINFLVATTAKILKDGTHIVKRAVTETLFAEVEKYERMIVYDHFRKICSYISDIEDIRSFETTYILSVLRCPSEVAEAVAEAIVKKEGKN